MSPALKALILNHLGVTDLPQVFGLQWEPAPEGFMCPNCQGALERTVAHTLANPWAGSVRCTACEYKHSVIGHLGNALFPVEPLPTGGSLTFDRDTGVIDAILADEPEE